MFLYYRFFQNLGDFSSAIQFLVLSKCNDEAFQMAQVLFWSLLVCTVINAWCTLSCYKFNKIYFEHFYGNIVTIILIFAWASLHVGFLSPLDHPLHDYNCE
jgi:tellurite resistance protein TehA-like permease